MSQPQHPQPPSGQQPPPPGWGQPPAGAAWGGPTPPPKKSNAGKIVGFGCLGFVGFLVIVGIIGAVIGGGSDSDSPTATKQTASSPAKKSDTSAKDTEAEDQAADGPEGDVKITTCEVESAFGWPRAKLTITNRSSKTSNYMVQVEFVDSSGTRISDGYATVNNLAAGQASKETAQGTAEAEGKITCKVTEVTRYAS